MNFNARIGPCQGPEDALYFTITMDLLQEMGERLTELRHKKGYSRQALAKRAGLSTRFLVEVESGRGNIAISRLAALCDALDVPIVSLFAALPSCKERKKLALIGLRGAGKTTIGKKVAAKLKWQFIELDEWIEKAAGLTLQNIFEVHGEDYYSRMEREVLQQLVAKDEPMVIAAGGGIVTREETFALLRQNCLTIWLKADPKDHWDRVLQQDPRPMANYPNAMEQLKNILQMREPLYSLADFQIDTSERGITGSVRQIISRAQQ